MYGNCLPSEVPLYGVHVLGYFICIFIFFYHNFKKDFTYLFSDRGKGWLKERERNIDVGEKHRLVASSTPPTEHLAHNPRMCLDLELTSHLPVCGPVLSPLSHTSQGSLAIISVWPVYYLHLEVHSVFLFMPLLPLKAGYLEKIRSLIWTMILKFIFYRTDLFLNGMWYFS